MKYALITGASRGIGRAIAIKMAQEGYAVVINYLNNHEAAQQTLEQIVAEGGNAELLQFDVAQPEAIEQAVADWQQRHPDDYIDVLVNNAGIRRDNLMVFMQNDEWESVVNTSLNGFFHLTRRLLKDMITHRHGRVINISSVSGLKGMAGQVNYSAAKAALIGATKALAQEVAARKVTVNAVAPGFIESDMTGDLNQDELKKLVPMKRFGKAEEVAALVAFLASDGAAYITGEAIAITGGL
ncbi:MAG: 3-oxoacyl-ACP reductase FabG [Prevotella shahii]|jgi:3-oxoacyl-[acyl-carrier-protein] reductase|uniref:3-oxoacyl-[acyl-carrier protein] reductase n=1 Tax=Hoylesella shahii DSM 15611 = JCM 12083 TaxID=1122991 RepID=A0A318HW09_9BACT|nr:3-oxoacyl-ACP reductase FabG [Hoylesella shahii]MBF1567852.1 3-oxoacyl-ACP reductase FabG [Hoylesella shahii]MBF1575619.1 3-oxoacyl-ACP reductase FabG [Hoylesella shahii]PXX22599.1 3-oxoacyl-[acyl-carrier protein] reductase [Hoylesella shahii DSM 15611 = JCM 12083]